LEVKTWKELSPELALLFDLTDMSSYIFIGIILLGLSFGIVNTMLMSVLERTRELGMLMALGMNRRRLFSLIFLETLFLVFAGVPLGLLLSLLTVAWTGHQGIDFSAFSDAFTGWGYAAVVYPGLQPVHYAVIVGIGGPNRHAFFALSGRPCPAPESFRRHPKIENEWKP
jgi:ABC-type antimicrobial peptide transport system permease subunit